MRPFISTFVAALAISNAALHRGAHSSFHSRSMVVAMSEPKRYSIYLENTRHSEYPLNVREYVVRVLIMVCDVSAVEAQNIMLEARENWMACCGTWEEQLAQHVVYEGMRKAGLSAAISMAEESDDPRPRYLDGTVVESDLDMPHWYQ